MNEQAQTTELQKVADSLNNQFTETQLKVIKNTVAKGTTNVELAYFLFTAQSVGLNPLNKEIWCYKDYKNNLIVFSGRDGFLKKAQKDPRWNGIVSSEVRENDFFEVDIPNDKISHKPNYLEDRGNIIGAYCRVKPKDTEIATIEWVDFKTYNRGGGKYKNAWDTHPADMIKKVAETHGLKKGYGISGIQSEYDFQVKGNRVEAIDNDSTNYVKLLKEKVESYDVENKPDLKQYIEEKEAVGELTNELAKQILNKL